MLAALIQSQEYETTESAVMRKAIEREYEAKFMARERESNPNADSRQELQKGERMAVSHTPVIVQNPSPANRGKRTA